MTLSFSIAFNGQCEEAFQFYEEHLNGTRGFNLSYKDSPLSDSVPQEWQDKIVHANMEIGSIELSGADLQDEDYETPKGFALSLGVESEDKLKRVFELLANKGNVILTPQRTFWSPCYGIVVDRFAVPWKLNLGA